MQWLLCWENIENDVVNAKNILSAKHLECPCKCKEYIIAKHVECHHKRKEYIIDKHDENLCQSKAYIKNIRYVATRMAIFAVISSLSAFYYVNTADS